MKNENSRKCRPFILKRSISARILLVVFVILLAVMLVMQFFIGKMFSASIEEYYSDVGELFASLTSSEIELFLDDLDSDMDEDTEEELLDLCIDYNIYSLWVETSKPPYEVGVNKIYISPEDYLLKRGKDYKNQKYELSEQEKAIFTGKVDNAVYQYTSSDGHDLVAYLHGVYDENDNCKAVVGANFDRHSIYKTIEGSAVRLFLIIGGVFVGLMIVLGLFFHFSIFGPLRMISKRMRDYVSNGGLSSEKLQVRGEDELSRMTASYNTMTEEIEKYIKKVGALEKQRLTTEAEMNVAAQIQTGMLPPASFDAGQIHIDAAMKPAKEVAGDFYDYLPLPDGRMFFCMADVSGKGISAALFMVEAINAIRYNAVLYSSPAKTMMAANNDLYARNPEMLFVTAFAAVYDPADGSLTYCNAGHDPVYLTKSGTVDILNGADCLLLGMFPDEEYTEASVDIAPGNLLFVYTDGLTEAIDPDRTMFGRERMEEELRDYASKVTDESLPARMAAAVNAFIRGAEAHDDLTMMAIRFGRSVVLPAVEDENGNLRQFLLEEEALPLSEMKTICLASEEIFVNICRYAYAKKETGTVRISTLLTDESYFLMFADTGKPYNPLEEVTDADEYDPDEQIGGLGKLMAFTIMERRKYEYRDGFNILTLGRSLKIPGKKES